MAYNLVIDDDPLIREMIEMVVPGVGQTAERQPAALATGKMDRPGR